MSEVVRNPADKPLLRIRNLRTDIHTHRGILRAVDGISLDVRRGEVVGIVGESGCGKSMTALSILRLVPETAVISADELALDDRDILSMNKEELRQFRGNEAALIFQDPMTSLNPVLRIGDQVAESLSSHRQLTKTAASSSATDLLRQVNIPSPAERARDYPHHFSGGMRQRVMIAMGIANEPQLLIADEPTTALDVTVQAQVLELIRELISRRDMAMILITHNMALVASLCTRVIVMYAGRIVEEGTTEEVFEAPQHPYTWALLQSIPRLDRDPAERLPAIDGLPPDLIDPPPACRFQPRCPFSIERCAVEEPALEDTEAGHPTRCWVLMSNVDKSLRGPDRR
jgi:oligopeptide/dipeptide ABC transporter ATP-binding protein